MDERKIWRVGDIVEFLPKPAPTPQPVFEGGWNIIVAHERTEHFVMRSAMLAGLEAWYPERTYWSNVTRRHPEPWKLKAPLFPGYVFSRAAAGQSFYDRVNAMREVVTRQRGDEVVIVPTNIPIAVGLLKSRERLLTIRAGDIERLQTQVAAGVFDETKGAVRGNPRGLRTGDAVQIIDGPFAWFEAIVAEIQSDKGLALVEVSIFGRMSRTEMPLDALKRIA
ncbi:transcription antitermination protein nusG [Kaistia soli DSM 19436]|uniref:Transcription antitermination protein nusG n=1 Tax=Kaistia soli DSM 19436 TaxID=1122133 RepID=A0A1M4VF35_9HYPH|nr:hypothetical protein [Kaistia soli]SHE67460.1 transcription antitermination protein nusG [Kaistia soli DSM 19436]